MSKNILKKTVSKKKSEHKNRKKNCLQEKNSKQKCQKICWKNSLQREIRAQKIHLQTKFIFQKKFHLQKKIIFKKKNHLPKTFPSKKKFIFKKNSSSRKIQFSKNNFLRKKIIFKKIHLQILFSSKPKQNSSRKKFQVWENRKLENLLHKEYKMLQNMLQV